MHFMIEIDDRASDRLKHLCPNVRAALRLALEPLTASVTTQVRATALAHIHTTGTQPGLYLASIYGGVSEKDYRVSGYVRSGNQLAHLLEDGVKERTIRPKKKKVLAFMGTAGMVFAKIVTNSIPPYPAFRPVFEARQAEIQKTLTEAVDKVLNA